MRIGTLTFHRVMNYGAILQAYALEKKIEELGGLVEIIDYRSQVLEQEAKVIKKSDKVTIKSIPKFFFRFIKNCKFKKFMKKNLKLSDKVVTESEFAVLGEKYDAIIVGSDQVWNDGCIRGDKTFFLNSIKDNYKKYSYAASIGGDEERALSTMHKYGEQMGCFQMLSLRENNVLEILNQRYEGKVRMDIDPVLLLSKRQWMDVMSPRREKKPYIFMYLVGAPVIIREFAKVYASKYGLKLIDNKASFEFLRFCSPEDFISWVYYADVVITNSFHGTAFSILLEKKFYTEYRLAKGYNYRSKQLIELLGISGREIVEVSCNNDEVEIEYSKVKNNLDVYIKNSNDYLGAILEQGKGR